MMIGSVDADAGLVFRIDEHGVRTRGRFVTRIFVESS